MRFNIGAIAAALVLWSCSALAHEDLTADDRFEIRAVIESQLAAFRRDDATEAFSYAAPTIREKFGDAATFIDMVRSAYTAVYRPSDVQFRDIDTSGTLPIQEVLVVGPQGRSFIAHYPMQQQPDGTWLIAGCFLSLFEGEAT